MPRRNSPLLSALPPSGTSRCTRNPMGRLMSAPTPNSENRNTRTPPPGLMFSVHDRVRVCWRLESPPRTLGRPNMLQPIEPRTNGTSHGRSWRKNL